MISNYRTYNFSLALILVLFLQTKTFAQNKQFDTKDIHFFNGSIKLSGKLYIPKTTTPYKAVVFTHGSGPAGTDNPRYKEEAEILVKQGIACLVYDKRGYGNSTGDWRKSTYEDLSLDAIAAVKHLKTSEDINVTLVGLRGSSQSGWIIPIAAQKSKLIDFLILISPPGVNAYDQIVYDVRTDVADMGCDVNAVTKAQEVIKSGLAFAQGKITWEEHWKGIVKYKDEIWFEKASGPTSKDHWLWSWVAPLLEFDALPLISKIQIPILIILGDKDREVPAQIAGYRFEKVLKNREGKYKIVYFPNADHSLRKTNDSSNKRPALADGYLNLIYSWIGEL